MSIVRTWTFVFCAAGVVVALAVAGEERDGGVMIIKQWKERHSGAKDPRKKVIRSAAEWEEAWKTAHAKSYPPPAVPEVDFDKHMVLAVYCGAKPTGGYAVEITKVKRTDGIAKVYFREITPAPGVNKAQARTSPTCFAVIPKLNEKVDFVKERREPDAE